MTALAAIFRVVLGIIVFGAMAVVALVAWQGRRVPQGDPHYVAMGSSFAAGIGLGPRAPGSPIACMRTINGYPQQLARLLHITILDVTSSGATTAHILHGGQYFQRAQLDAVTAATQLVTITSGGNDIGYVGGLSAMAARNSPTFVGWVLRHMRRAPQPRDYDAVRRDLTAVVTEVRRRAPRARVVLVTYPTILPPSGTCARLNLTEGEVRDMREVGDQLAQATAAAAAQTGALLVDMNRLGADHHACSAQPWANGWVDVHGTPFHPTLLGAQETAAAIAAALHRQP